MPKRFIIYFLDGSDGEHIKGFTNPDMSRSVAYYFGLVIPWFYIQAIFDGARLAIHEIGLVSIDDLFKPMSELVEGLSDWTHLHVSFADNPMDYM